MVLKSPLLQAKRGLPCNLSVTSEALKKIQKLNAVEHNNFRPRQVEMLPMSGHPQTSKFYNSGKIKRQTIEARERLAPGVMVINFIRRRVIWGCVLHRGRLYLVKRDENALEGLFIEV